MARSLIRSQGLPDIARRTVAEVGDVGRSRAWYQNQGFPRSRISRTAMPAAGASNETNLPRVQTGGQLVGGMSSQMQDLSMTHGNDLLHHPVISEENAKIIRILATLDQITSQTNLLSLDTSIRLPRPGMARPAVATEIRQLSTVAPPGFTRADHGILTVSRSRPHRYKEILTGQKSVETCT